MTQKKKTGTRTKSASKEAIDTLKKQLDEKDKLIEGHLDSLKRLQAEFENYMKRTEKEKMDLVKYSKRTMAESMVALVDNMERAFHTMENSSKEDLVKGLEMTFKEFVKSLEKEGIVPIESVGKKFDPHFHEVIKTTESDQDEGTIIQELEKGYMFHDKVLRPSRVIISGGN